MLFDLLGKGGKDSAEARYKRAPEEAPAPPELWVEIKEVFAESEFNLDLTAQEPGAVRYLQSRFGGLAKLLFSPTLAAEAATSGESSDVGRAMAVAVAAVAPPNPTSRLPITVATEALLHPDVVASLEEALTGTANPSKDPDSPEAVGAFAVKSRACAFVESVALSLLDGDTHGHKDVGAAGSKKRVALQSLSAAVLRLAQDAANSDRDGGAACDGAALAIGAVCTSFSDSSAYVVRPALESAPAKECYGLVLSLLDSLCMEQCHRECQGGARLNEVLDKTLWEPKWGGSLFGSMLASAVSPLAVAERSWCVDKTWCLLRELVADVKGERAPRFTPSNDTLHSVFMAAYAELSASRSDPLSEALKSSGGAGSSSSDVAGSRSLRIKQLLIIIEFARLVVATGSADVAASAVKDVVRGMYAVLSNGSSKIPARAPVVLQRLALLTTALRESSEETRKLLLGDAGLRLVDLVAQLAATTGATAKSVNRSAIHRVFRGSELPLVESANIAATEGLCSDEKSIEFVKAVFDTAVAPALHAASQPYNREPGMNQRRERSHSNISEADIDNLGKVAAGRPLGVLLSPSRNAIPSSSGVVTRVIDLTQPSPDLGSPLVPYVDGADTGMPTMEQLHVTPPASKAGPPAGPPPLGMFGGAPVPQGGSSTPIGLVSPEGSLRSSNDPLDAGTSRQDLSLFDQISVPLPPQLPEGSLAAGDPFQNSQPFQDRSSGSVFAGSDSTTGAPATDLFQNSHSVHEQSTEARSLFAASDSTTHAPATDLFQNSQQLPDQSMGGSRSLFAASDSVAPATDLFPQNSFPDHSMGSRSLAAGDSTTSAPATDLFELHPNAQVDTPPMAAQSAPNQRRSTPPPQAEPKRHSLDEIFRGM